MELTPDIIVVGAGSAGCAIARRLADKGIRVLLVEAGKTDRTLRSRIPALVGGVVNDPEFDWSYKAEPDQSVGGRQDVWPAGRRLGGGSAINGMMFIRGHRHDYDRWAELGASGWDYASVLPDFRRLEDRPADPLTIPPIANPLATEDGLAALALVRANAEEWGIDPARVGMIGFSAGAMATLTTVLSDSDGGRPDFFGYVYGP